MTAIAAVYLARGRPLGWLEGQVNDVPISLLAETKGSGDDVQLRYLDGSVAEIQIKRGLAAGKRLWDSLLKLSEAINSEAINYGVLVVCPNSSRTITKELSRDVKRLADGRADGLSEIAETFRSKLAAANLSVQPTCQRLSIVTVNALHSDDASIGTARAQLEHICKDKTQVSHAWDRLCRDAGQLMELRGQRSASSVIQVLRSAGIEIASDAQDSPGAVLEVLCKWVLSTNASFTIFGVAQPLMIDKSWIPIKTVVRESVSTEEGGLAEALERYHAWDKRQSSRESASPDPETLGRFFRHAVVVAGPGMGKSTLLTKLARRYALEGYPVLRLSLKSLATRMQIQGSTFSEGLFALGLDGSGLTVTAAQNAGLSDWVLLCDGLDECGAGQDVVMKGLLDYVAGHPDCRVIVTTRPIGYCSAPLAAWRHYELLPPEVSFVPGYLADLVRSIVPENHRAHRDALSLVTAQLEKSSAKGLITRSPLIIGMTASLIVRSGVLARTKTELYGKLFDLIDDAPNTRAPVPESRSVRRRFLNLLGWDLLANPLSRPDATIERCAKQLAHEMGCLPLQASQIADNCLRYWQDVGILERVHHAGEEVVTFIHKTFGEFVAARYLQSLPVESQRQAIAATLDQDAWSEVLSFAGSLGLATLIGAEMLERRQPAEMALRMTERLLVLASEADLAPEPRIRKHVFDRAFVYVCSDGRMEAYRVGKALVSASERFPSEIGGLAAFLLDSEQPWTRLIAWACAVTAGPVYYELDRLKEALSALPRSVAQVVRGSLAGGLMFGTSDRDLAQQLALRGARAILDRCPPDEADALLPGVLWAESLGTLDFVQRVVALLEEKGKNYKTGMVQKYTDRLAANLNTEEYFRANRISYEKILAALNNMNVNTDIESAEVEPKTLLHLSAFFHITEFWTQPAYEVWAWNEPFNESAVQEVMRGVVESSGIERDQLARDVRVLLKSLRAARPEDGFRVRSRMANVDAPSPDFARVKSSNLDCAKLEEALYHRSSWMVPLAANLIASAGVSSEELRGIVGRLLSSGRGLTLWAASQLASCLDRDVAIDLAFKRLNQPLVDGCEYLFTLLLDLQVPFDRATLPVLRNALMTSDGEIATVAAELVLKFAEPGAADLNDLLAEAYEHWLGLDRAQAKKTKAIPASPRATLVSAIIRVKDPNAHDLIDYASDERTDVRDIGTAALLKRLAVSEESRELVVDAALNGAIPPALLKQVLRAKTPFSSLQVQRLCRLLSSTDPKWRYAALSVLDHAYLPEDKIVSFTKALSVDPISEIRDAILRLRDQ